MMYMPTLLPNNNDTVHLVSNDFGDLGCAYVETDEAKADEQTIVRRIAKGHYLNPVKVVALNLREGWCRDVTAKIAEAVLALGRRGDSLSPPALAFVERVLGVVLFPAR